jgi:hypothetical protein
MSGQSGPKMFVRLHLYRKKLDMVVYTCHLSEGGKHKIGELQSRPAWAKSKTLPPGWRPGSSGRKQA